MIWVILAILGVAGAATLFVIVTDGRYFGKRLMHWVYDCLGPAIFSTRSEAEHWRGLAEALELRGDEALLDVGTAVGDLPLTIAAMPNFRGQVVGIDWSPRMIVVAQAEAARRGLDNRARFQVADVRKALPFEDGEFDVVTCLGLLETLPHPERILRELRRILKPDGILVLSLYKSGPTQQLVALGLDWYQQHLFALGLQDLQVVSCRRHHDIVIARRSDDLSGRI